MGKNTIILSVEDYNSLRDFKINIEKGNTYSVLRDRFRAYDQFITTNEAVKEVLKVNEEMAYKFEEMAYKLLNPDVTRINGKTVLDVSKMSIWEFIKWKIK